MSVTRYYHRLELLSEAFAISACGFAVMDNHLHVPTRLDPNDSLEWTDRQVARKWLMVYPPRTMKLRNKQKETSKKDRHIVVC